MKKNFAHVFLGRRGERGHPCLIPMSWGKYSVGGQPAWPSTLKELLKVFKIACKNWPRIPKERKASLSAKVEMLSKAFDQSSRISVTSSSDL